MPRAISDSIKIQKNLIGSTASWIIFLDVMLPDNTIFYLVNNNEDILFQGRTYTRCRFGFEPPDETFGGEIPTCRLHIADVTRAFEGYIQKYRGGIDSSVIIRLVNTADLSADYASLTFELGIQKVDREGFEWLIFTLGAPNPMLQDFLPFIYSPNHCNWVFDFKGPECGYVGNATTCEGTFGDCRRLGNSKRFGGHLGLNATGLRFA
jgi:phage-related protein